MKKFSSNRNIFTNGLDVHLQFMNFKHEVVHEHDFFEFVYVIKGEIHNKIDGSEYVLRPGSLAFVDIGQTHEMNAIDRTDYVNILIKPEWFKGERETKRIADLFSNVYGETVVCNGGSAVRFEEMDKKVMDGLVHSMLEEYNAQKDNFGKIIDHEILAFLITVARKVRYGGMDVALNSVDNKMSEILQFIEENVNSDLSLEKVAKKYFYNSSYFSRMFKSVVGMTFKDYMQELKIKKALSLIYNSEYSIDKIVEEVGYANKKQFYNVFKRKMGTTPGRYKKNAKKTNPVKLYNINAKEQNGDKEGL